MRPNWIWRPGVIQGCLRWRKQAASGAVTDR
jgi:hypothetical protein